LFGIEYYSKFAKNNWILISSNLIKVSNSINPQLINELIKMYQKGIGCEKSASKANEILSVKEDYLLKQKLNSK
jgi:activator of HSP90 ATPase